MAFETNFVTEVDNKNDFDYLKFTMEKKEIKVIFIF